MAERHIPGTLKTQRGNSGSQEQDSSSTNPNVPGLRIRPKKDITTKVTETAPPTIEVDPNETLEDLQASVQERLSIHTDIDNTNDIKLIEPIGSDDVYANILNSPRDVAETDSSPTTMTSSLKRKRNIKHERTKSHSPLSSPRSPAESPRSKSPTTRVPSPTIPYRPPVESTLPLPFKLEHVPTEPESYEEDVDYLLKLMGTFRSKLSKILSSIDDLTKFAGALTSDWETMTLDKVITYLDPITKRTDLMGIGPLPLGRQTLVLDTLITQAKLITHCYLAIVRQFLTLPLIEIIDKSENDASSGTSSGTFVKAAIPLAMSHQYPEWKRYLKALSNYHYSVVVPRNSYQILLDTAIEHGDIGLDVLMEAKERMQMYLPDGKYRTLADIKSDSVEITSLIEIVDRAIELYKAVPSIFMEHSATLVCPHIKNVDHYVYDLLSGFKQMLDTPTKQINFAINRPQTPAFMVTDRGNVFSDWSFLSNVSRHPFAIRNLFLMADYERPVPKKKQGDEVFPMTNSNTTYNTSIPAAWLLYKESDAFKGAMSMNYHPESTTAGSVSDVELEEFAMNSKFMQEYLVDSPWQKDEVLNAFAKDHPEVIELSKAFDTTPKAVNLFVFGIIPTHLGTKASSFLVNNGIGMSVGMENIIIEAFSSSLSLPKVTQPYAGSKMENSNMSILLGSRMTTFARAGISKKAMSLVSGCNPSSDDLFEQLYRSGSVPIEELYKVYGDEIKTKLLWLKEEEKQVANDQLVYNSHTEHVARLILTFRSHTKYPELMSSLIDDLEEASPISLETTKTNTTRFKLTQKTRLLIDEVCGSIVNHPKYEHLLNYINMREGEERLSTDILNGKHNADLSRGFGFPYIPSVFNLPVESVINQKNIPVQNTKPSIRTPSYNRDKFSEILKNYDDTNEELFSAAAFNTLLKVKQRSGGAIKTEDDLLFRKVSLSISKHMEEMAKLINMKTFRFSGDVLRANMPEDGNSKNVVNNRDPLYTYEIERYIKPFLVPFTTFTIPTHQLAVRSLYKMAQACRLQEFPVILECEGLDGNVIEDPENEFLNMTHYSFYQWLMCGIIRHIVTFVILYLTDLDELEYIRDAVKEVNAFENPSESVPLPSLSDKDLYEKMDKERIRAMIQKMESSERPKTFGECMVVYLDTIVNRVQTMYDNTDKELEEHDRLRAEVLMRDENETIIVLLIGIQLTLVDVADALRGIWAGRTKLSHSIVTAEGQARTELIMNLLFTIAFSYGMAYFLPSGKPDKDNTLKGELENAISKLEIQNPTQLTEVDLQKLNEAVEYSYPRLQTTIGEFVDVMSDKGYTEIGGFRSVVSQIIRDGNDTSDANAFKFLFGNDKTPLLDDETITQTEFYAQLNRMSFSSYNVDGSDTIISSKKVNDEILNKVGAVTGELKYALVNTTHNEADIGELKTILQPIRGYNSTQANIDLVSPSAILKDMYAKLDTAKTAIHEFIKGKELRKMIEENQKMRNKTTEFVMSKLEEWKIKLETESTPTDFEKVANDAKRAIDARADAIVEGKSIPSETFGVQAPVADKATASWLDSFSNTTLTLENFHKTWYKALGVSVLRNLPSLFLMFKHATMTNKIELGNASKTVITSTKNEFVNPLYTQWMSYISYIPYTPLVATMVYELSQIYKECKRKHSGALGEDIMKGRRIFTFDFPQVSGNSETTRFVMGERYKKTADSNYVSVRNVANQILKHSREGTFRARLIYATTLGEEDNDFTVFDALVNTTIRSFKGTLISMGGNITKQWVVTCAAHAIPLLTQSCITSTLVAVVLLLILTAYDHAKLLKVLVVSQTEEIERSRGPLKEPLPPPSTHIAKVLSAPASVIPPSSKKEDKDLPPKSRVPASAVLAVGSDSDKNYDTSEEEDDVEEDESDSDGGIMPLVTKRKDKIKSKPSSSEVTEIKEAIPDETIVPPPLPGIVPSEDDIDIDYFSFLELPKLKDAGPYMLSSLNWAKTKADEMATNPTVNTLKTSVSSLVRGIGNKSKKIGTFVYNRFPNPRNEIGSGLKAKIERIISPSDKEDDLMSTLEKRARDIKPAKK